MTLHRGQHSALPPRPAPDANGYGTSPPVWIRFCCCATYAPCSRNWCSWPTLSSWQIPPECRPHRWEVFLSSLKVLWHNGEARPTAVHKTPPKRERRRPDPRLHVTDQLKTWFEDEPWRTGRQLLEKLQAEQPNIYPDGLLRTIQRRLKGWRTEQARALVFSYSARLRSAAPVNAEAINTAM